MPESHHQWRSSFLRLLLIISTAIHYLHCTPATSIFELWHLLRCPLMLLLAPNTAAPKSLEHSLEQFLSAIDILFLKMGNFLWHSNIGNSCLINSRIMLSCLAGRDLGHAPIYLYWTHTSEVMLWNECACVCECVCVWMWICVYTRASVWVWVHI